MTTPKELRHIKQTLIALQMEATAEKVSESADEIERLESRVKELEQDAARFEFLLANPSCSPMIVTEGNWIVQKSIGHTIGRGATQRAAIDAAMNQSK